MQHFLWSFDHQVTAHSGHHALHHELCSEEHLGLLFMTSYSIRLHKYIYSCYIFNKQPCKSTEQKYECLRIFSMIQILKIRVNSHR